MTQQKIAEKIAKIIAKANGTTSEGEAAVFMEKAREMMIQHGLTMLDLGTLDKDDPVDVSYGLTKNGTGDTWQLKLAAVLANYYGCKLVQTKIGNVTYHHIIGRESGRVTYGLMFPFIKKQVNALGRKAHAEGRHPTYARARSAIGNALVARIALLNLNQQDESAGGRPGLNALVPVDMIEAAQENAFPGARARAKSIARLRYGYDDMADADRVSLHQQTEGRGPSALLGA